MQTFLPFPSFDESARVLDGPRLGKQRVETLQVLRALVLPTYGWQRHPVTTMWRGFVPGLAAYGLATVQAWTDRGYGDTVGDQILEFAPEIAGLPQAELAERGLLPPWIGDPAVHESHRSRLIAKDAAFYRPLFPGTPEGLDYVWPAGADPVDPEHAEGLWVLRTEHLEPWRSSGLIGLPGVDPRGKVTPAWRQQLRAFEDELVPGALVALLADEQPRTLHLAEVTGEVAPAVVDGTPCTAVAVRFEGDLERSALPVPAVLQNPRRFFHVRLASSLDALVDAGA